MAETRRTRLFAFLEHGTGLRRNFARLSTAACVILIAFTLTATSSFAQTLTTLDSFSGGANGAFPSGTLIQSTDGNLYGTTSGGQGEGEGNGTVFKLGIDGTLTTLYAFCEKSGCTDGSLASGGVVEGPDGNFYGTTNSGGTYGAGTVFKITPKGTLTTLYSFCAQANCADGSRPDYPSLLLSDGYFYGTTQGDFATAGTIFRINSSGILTTLHSFCSETNCSDGATPSAGLIQGTNGLLYGATDLGGTNQQGTIYEITKAGKFKTVYTFCSLSGCADGSEPIAGIIQANDGNFYGTTSGLGGQSTPYGTVFRLTPSGTLTTLHVFDFTDGSWPAAMIQATDGNLYGTTWHGGLFGGGTLFRISLNGALTTLYNFCSKSACSDGQTPIAGLMQETNGEFYGTTEEGGNPASCNGGTCGTAFSFSMGLGPFVETEPASGKPHTKFVILGNSLTGTTRVSLNGTPATFKIVSDGLIQAIVPTGATSGVVEVTTRSGKLFSNVAFRVLP